MLASEPGSPPAHGAPGAPSITRDVPWVYHGARSVSFPSQGLSRRPLNKFSSPYLTEPTVATQRAGKVSGKSLWMEVSPPVEATPSSLTPIAPVVGKATLSTQAGGLTSASPSIPFLHSPTLPGGPLLDPPDLYSGLTPQGPIAHWPRSRFLQHLPNKLLPGWVC